MGMEYVTIMRADGTIDHAHMDILDPEPAPEPEPATTVWDELAAAITEGVNAV